MLSPRRTAQLGLIAATLMLVTSVTLLVAGASDAGNKPPSSASNISTRTGQVTPLASGQIGSLQTELTNQPGTGK